MSPQELTVLLLGLAISSVLLHGLFVSVQACKSQVRLAIAKNIPQDFDLDSLEAATAKGDSPLAQHSRGIETEPQHPQDTGTGQNHTHATANETLDPLAHASARAASLQLDRNAEPIPMLIDSVTLSHKAMQPGHENEDGMKKDTQNEATFEIMDYANHRESELPAADKGQQAGVDPKTPDEFSELEFVKTLADHESAAPIPEPDSGYRDDRPAPSHDGPESTAGYGDGRPATNHDGFAQTGFDETDFAETDLNKGQSNEREPDPGRYAPDGNERETIHARGERGEMWEAQARQETQKEQSQFQQNEPDDILLDYSTNASSDTDVDDGMAAVRPDYPEDTEHNGNYADNETGCEDRNVQEFDAADGYENAHEATETNQPNLSELGFDPTISDDPDEITMTAGERIGFQSSDKTAAANHGVQSTEGKRTSLFWALLNKIAQPLAARDGKQRTKRKTAGWLKQIRQNGLPYQTGAEFWEEMRGNTRGEARAETRERTLMQADGIEPLTDVEINPNDEPQQQSTKTQEAHDQAAKTRQDGQRGTAEPATAAPYREPVQQELVDFQPEPGHAGKPFQNGSAPASTKVSQRHSEGQPRSSAPAAHDMNQHPATSQANAQPMAEAEQPSLASRPSELLVLNLMAHPGRVFNGDDLLRAVITRGLQFGEMNIFHYRENKQAREPVIFSLANILKPGTFDLNNMSGFSTVGVTLFLSLPVADSYANSNYRAFEQMLTVARDLCAALDGELRDDHRNLMTAQTIEHYRQRVRDFELKLLQATPGHTNVNQRFHKQPEIRSSY